MGTPRFDKHNGQRQCRRRHVINIGDPSTWWVSGLSGLPYQWAKWQSPQRADSGNYWRNSLQVVSRGEKQHIHLWVAGTSMKHLPRQKIGRRPWHLYLQHGMSSHNSVITICKVGEGRLAGWNICRQHIQLTRCASCTTPWTPRVCLARQAANLLLHPIAGRMDAFARADPTCRDAALGVLLATSQQLIQVAGPRILFLWTIDFRKTR